MSTIQLRESSTVQNNHLSMHTLPLLFLLFVNTVCCASSEAFPLAHFVCVNPVRRDPAIRVYQGRQYGGLGTPQNGLEPF